MSTIETLIAEIDEFLVRERMPATRFGRLAVNDTHLVQDLRGGRSIGALTIDRVRAFMKSYGKGRAQKNGHDANAAA